MTSPEGTPHSRWLAWIERGRVQDIRTRTRMNLLAQLVVIALACWSMWVLVLA